MTVGAPPQSCTVLRRASCPESVQFTSRSLTRRVTHLLEMAEAKLEDLLLFVVLGQGQPGNTTQHNNRKLFGCSTRTKGLCFSTRSHFDSSLKSPLQNLPVSDMTGGGIHQDGEVSLPSLPTGLYQLVGGAGVGHPSETAHACITQTAAVCCPVAS